MKTPGLLAEMIAEFLGTALILLFGSGVCSMVVLFGTGVPGEVVKGGFTNIVFGWAIGVTMGIYVVGSNFGRAPEPGGHAGAGRVSRLPVAQGRCLTRWRKRWAPSPARRWCSGITTWLLPRFDPMLERTAGIFTTLPGFSQRAVGGLPGPGDRHGAAAVAGFRDR